MARGRSPQPDDQDPRHRCGRARHLGDHRQGINVNVTLLFSQDAYIKVAEAYVAGLEERAKAGQPIDRIASVASFFISRIDSAIDKKIDERVGAGDAEADALKAIRGKVAIANARWRINGISSF
ncbi:Transaldolase [Sphingomonas paucimobilis]|nr:Transaldolase [Sphingomonas paucimobilis]